MDISSPWIHIHIHIHTNLEVQERADAEKAREEKLLVLPAGKEIFIGRTQGSGWIVRNEFRQVERLRGIVTANPPTQGRRKIAVRVGNITRRVNSLAFIQRSQSPTASHWFACIYRHYQTPTASDPLWLSQRLTDSVSRYICVSSRLVSTQAPTTPNKARNGGQAYLHLALALRLVGQISRQHSVTPHPI